MSNGAKLFVLLLALPVAVAAAAAADNGKTLRVLREQLVSSLPGLKAEDIQATPVAGLYEITSGGQLSYVTADGKYLVNGDLIEIAGRHNLSESRRSAARLKLLAAVKPADTINFSPAVVKHTVTAFVDVDCGFCRKLQREMSELNGHGIAVRYVAFPRTGPDTKSWSKMEAVWCASDRKDAFAKAMSGEAFAESTCQTPVAAQFDLGDKLGVEGTPTFVTDTGALIVGFSSAAQLIARLDSATLATAGTRQ